MHLPIKAIKSLAVVVAGFASAGSGFPSDIPAVFPIPKEIVFYDGSVVVDASSKILLPEKAGAGDLFLSRLLAAELNDVYLSPVSIESGTSVPSGRACILMGSRSNALVNRFIAQNRLDDTLKPLGSEGYVLRVTRDSIVVAANTDQGAFFGFQSLRQLMKMDNGKVIVPRVAVHDRPALPFRGIRLFIPGRDHIPFFKRFVRDFMALYKFNKLILEVNGVMRLDRHPEINAGTLDFFREMIYSRRDRPEGPRNQYQDSAHHDVGDGQILGKDEVRDLVEYIRQFHIEVIPEIPSLTHVYYLLNRHRELAEIKNAEWPDTYCPSNPESYRLLFDVLDEYIEVMRPGMVHIGHDEWRMPMDICPLCKGKDYRELFAQDVCKIHNYLNRRGVLTAMWGDHLLENVAGKEYQDRKSPSGFKYRIPGAVTPEQAAQSIPKDILVFNWFWGDEKNDLDVEQFGFKQVYGNFRPNISRWDDRSRRSSVTGGAPSSWAGTTEMNFGKDLLFDFLGCANLLWSEHAIDHAGLAESVRSFVPGIRRRLHGKILPSEGKNTITPVEVGNYLNLDTETDLLGTTFGTLRKGKAGGNTFTLVDPQSTAKKAAIAVGTAARSESPLPKEVTDIRIDEDVSSLIFLHACVREAGNEKAYRMIYNFDDAADLLGWYEVLYEDGFVETIPIRYGVNILDMNSGKRSLDPWAEGKTGEPQNVYCYLAGSVECSRNAADSKIFYAFEWENPRFGKAIKTVNLKGSRGFRNVFRKSIPENAIVLLALSKVGRRPIPSLR